MNQKKDNVFECSAVTRGIEIEITNYCTMECIVCPRKQLKSFSFLSFDNFRKIVSLLKEGNYEEIMVCGLGDAFLHKEINDFMEYLFKEIPTINLFFMTKGGSIKDFHLEKILSLKERGFNVSLTFSVFSLEEKLYNKLTGGDYYANFMNLLKKANKMNINYSMEFMLSLLNIKELNGFIKLAKSLNKDYGISLVHNWGGIINKKIHNQFFDEEKLKGYFIRRKENDLCEVMKYDYLYINSNGGVYQCSLNELYETGYLGEIGQYSLKEFLEKKNNLDYLKLCNKCFYFNYKTFN
ncbi:radical SAM protein [Candidatus Gracilibacteria bacterium]|nr:radical SAM protein [Candidatus Gracilibacteria bacterium]